MESNSINNECRTLRIESAPTAQGLESQTDDTTQLARVVLPLAVSMCQNGTNTAVSDMEV